MKEILRIVPLIYAESVLGEDKVFAGDSREVKLPISFTIYLLETKERRILVDAGCETMPGFDMRNFISPVEALRRIGLDAGDITDVIITHSHHDHMEALHRFPNAVVHIQQDELEKGRKFVPQAMNVQPFEREALVDDSVRVVRIGGHSIGSCVAEFTLNGERCVICGDEVYSSECFRRGIPTGASCNPAQSQAFLKEYTSGWRHFLCHAPVAP